MLDLSRLDLEEIATALQDQTDYEHRWLINPQTGEIVFWTTDGGIDGHTPVDLDDLDLVGIDPLPSYVWYQDMADFAERISDAAAGRGLARAIQGRGAFRRFKNELKRSIRTCCRRGMPSATCARGGGRLNGWSTTRWSTTKRASVPWPSTQIPTSPELAPAPRDFLYDERTHMPRRARHPKVTSAPAAGIRSCRDRYVWSTRRWRSPSAIARWSGRRRTALFAVTCIGGRQG